MRNSGLALVAWVLLLIIGAGCAGKSPELSSGIIYLRQENYQKAAELLESAVELDPENWEPHYQLAIAYMGLDRYTEAYPEFKKATELNPAKADEVKQKHYAYWYDHFMPGVTALKGKEYDEAQRLFRESIAIDPTRVEALSNLGFAYHKTGKTEESLEAYAGVVAVDPQNVDAWLAMAEIQKELNRHEETIASLEKILEIEPQNKTALLGIADSYRELGDNAKALAAYDRASAAMPDDAGLLFQMAVIHYKDDRLAEAARYFRKAAETSEPGGGLHLDALFNQAQMQVRLEDFEGAKNTVLELIKLKDDAPEYHDLIGRIYFRLGNQEEGMKEFERAKELEG